MISEVKEMEDGILIQFQYVINPMKKENHAIEKRKIRY